MTWKLIGWSILWSIVASIIIQIPVNMLKNITDNIFIYVVISLILSAIANYFVWKISINTAFKKFTVDKMQVQYIFKNLMLLLVILSILSGIIDIIESKDFSKELENSSEFKFINSMSHYLSQEEKLRYDKEMQEAMKKTQREVTGYTIVIAISNVFINIVALTLNKKNMYAKAEGEVQEDVIDEYKIRQ